ncbi:hypothetical protein GCM10012320_32780 [Sinomonas cellulolyticus]|uniref:Uncharacterized protein n=1 Tax=Sinomonas cellulolyticus TaxID=2801916 RepID=A0ABS1JY79_9MICC|nr:MULTISPECIES: hypothetical protein [Sinomonas]MBL0703972.1 hypothetical protein [Sinomonas cellulolyticus]GHG58962.1 hypothetical protein GCM10012320_32780 [Sinomonas sp. KCTC 49339]
MAGRKPSSLSRYTVLQADEAYPLFAAASAAGSTFELDLACPDHVLHVTVKPNGVHDDDGELRIMGRTEDGSLLNVILGLDRRAERAILATFTD